MQAQKLPMPATGTPKSGLVQFGNEQPGVYLSAEDAFALRLKLTDFTRDADRIPTGELFEAEDLENARDSIDAAAQSLDSAVSDLRKLLAPITFGNAAHVKQMLDNAPTSLAA